MSRTMTVLLACVSLLLGSLLGAGITSLRSRRNERVARSVRTYFGSKDVMDDLALIDQSEIEELKQQMEERLAMGVVEAEVMASRKDRAGEIARETLSATAPHRSSPSYIRAEAAVRQMLGKKGNPQKGSGT